MSATITMLGIFSGAGSGGPEGDLSKNLVSKGAGHHEGGVSSSTAENDQ